MKTSVKTIDEAAHRLKGVVKNTPLEYSKRLSKLYKAHIYLKREDLQEVRSYKIRGAYNKMSKLTPEEKKRGVVCASAGNHAQGVAWGAFHLKVFATIFMPETTPLQKIGKVKHFGDGFVEIKLIGHTYDEAGVAAKEFAKKENVVYIPPFDDEDVISGQGTIGKEVYESLGTNIDYVVIPIGGGGCISGISTYLKGKIPNVSIIGAEPLGSPSMYEAVKTGKIKTLENIDTFVDGAAVGRPGDKTFKIIQKNVKKIILVPEGKACTTMIDLYQSEGIIAEPAGALSLSALDEIAGEIKGKTVVCVISGGNNDILRYPEIMERSLVYKGLKHYFLVEFAQKPGQLRNFLDKALGPTDDIVRFEYMKKTSKETGPALIGVELQKKEDYTGLTKRMKKLGIKYTELKSTDVLYRYLI